MTEKRAKPTDRPETAADGRQQSGSSLIVERRKSEKWAGVVYQLSYNRDPKTGRLRGPYWRGHYHDATRGRSTSRYIGKEFRELRADEF